MDFTGARPSSGRRAVLAFKSAIASAFVSTFASPTDLHHNSTSLDAPPQRLLVDLVDVRRVSVQPVRIWLEGGLLQIAGPQVLKQVPWPQIDWLPPGGPDARRTARLPDGSALCAVNPQEWDDWLARCGEVSSPSAKAATLRPPTMAQVSRLSRHLWLLEIAAIVLVVLAACYGH